ncbi:MAG: multiprotein bridging factor aMBF1 [Candidatus Hodarchaeota archaeon]
MHCEICGQTIQTPKYVSVEGARLIVCANCTRFGSPVRPPSISPERKKAKVVKSKLSTRTRTGRPVENETDFELVEDFSVRVKTAREKRGLKQEDLGKMIKEKASTISKIETGRYRPTEKTIKKIEIALEIDLHESSPTAIESPKRGARKSPSLTLGDLIVIKERKKKST